MEACSRRLVVRHEPQRLITAWPHTLGFASSPQPTYCGGLKATLWCIDTTQLDARFAGRAFDHALLDELPEAVDPCGENGEFHTCVNAGPFFHHALSVECGDLVLRDSRFMYADIAPIVKATLNKHPPPA
ncbi:MAG: hypothetical protein KDI75_04175 [Xanthomonadales bacterium]|nr:hypothetical protein [Xanthomonadales bacterium]